MLDRFSRSWQLMRTSAQVLATDREMLLFPLAALAALAVLVVASAAPALHILFTGQQHGRQASMDSAYLLLFVFYFGHFFVAFFFNTALVGAAMMRLEGQDPTFRDGLRIASSRLGAIAGWALIAATVGFILRVIEERAGFVGRIVAGLLGVAWSVATFMVVPVLAVRDVGPVDAIKESAGLIRETWGENVLGRVGLGAAFAVIYIGIFAFGIALLAAASHSVALLVAAVIAVIVLLSVTGLVQSALGGIYSAALYHYAETGETRLGFDEETMQLAFAPK